MKKWFFLVLFGCGLAQADMLDALKAYDDEDYATAKQQFAELLPLGNDVAAFNLGAMAYQGEGQEKDLSEALAYFMLAAELEHPQAKALLPDVVKNTTEQQLEQANQRYEQLKRSVVIVATDLDKPRDDSLPQPIKRVNPNYPVNAAKNGQFGYVKLRFLVDEKGQVTTVDTLDSYPENVFERASIRAVKRWRYQPSGQKHLFNVRLDYSLGDGVKVSAVEDTVAKYNLWDYAVAGSPQHQLALGMLLSLIEIQSHNSFWYNPELPLATAADFSIYKKRAELRPDFDGFWGYAVVRVAADGTITEQIKTEFEPRSEITDLVGLKLKGNVEADVYRLHRRSDVSAKGVTARPSIEASRTMSGFYWWEQAAKNGNKDAQRIMAAYDKQWEEYLLSQQDAEVMAWTGTRLILEGQRDQGIKLLEQAIAKNYKPAAEMKKQFM
ncbi:TonB family protein [Arsukibacterium indicum]|uniref:TonB family protein n=1 Tax=Arsukibacterium indicum TaxID=2848612 RepID=A0ABS6MQ67_9GAMM|nr:TonB family protein [Arsukibacterium indicum]MBV2130978.1 TonB family protein [Arsukibacterium indicum]